MRLFKTCLLALAALAAIGASTTSSAATVSSTLNVSLSFYDIDPLDGVGPSFSFLSTVPGSRTGIDNNPFPSIRDDSEWSSSTANADGGATANVNYQPTMSSYSTFAQYVLPTGSPTATAWSMAFLYDFIELGAGTGVTAFASAFIDAQDISQRQMADSSARVSIRGPMGLREGLNLLCCGFGASASRSGSGSVSYENTSAQSANIYIDSVIYTNLYSYSVNAVPEPETYALLLAGLGIVGAVARRRRVG